MTDTIKQIQDLIEEYSCDPGNLSSLKFAEEIDKLSKGEVVDYIRKNITIPYPVGSVGYKKWQAQLKKWGLK